ncbi:NADH-quinone oxidoreductase subunit J family protein [Desulfuromonas thiophila]|uniref:NADH-quinone oxidoreductase subunit J n=1 Tax=Desulfuromonas thiophila TaxID=57664 RepID=A0A1G6XBU0_9BACT|nr:NADH-quinone oxidoreductase subunit J [Desulfuromonas thiophila]SDD75283.1 NADH dehydrogenase subunit J [Desulfuromonas thiophila]
MDLLQQLFFYLVALVTLVSGFLVIRCKNPINSAISLVMTFFCLAVFYVMLHAPFMAAVQIMVYAGAIMVLIMFVIMLLNLGSEVVGRYRHAVTGALVAGGLLLLQLLILVKQGGVSPTGGTINAQTVEAVGHTELIGFAMFTDFLLPFEIASILLLVAIVGAVVLAKREV